MSASKSRYVYLDNLRVLAMLFGLFVHAVNLGDFGFMNLVTPISDAFRMALFFCISGFIAAAVMQKKSGREFVTDRFRNLLVPLFFGVLILNTATFLLAYKFIYGYWSVAGTWQALVESRDVNRHVFIWHLHLWFLISLVTYAAMAPAMLRLVRRYQSVVDGVGGSRLAAVWVIAAVVLLSFGLKVAANLIGRFAGDLPWLVQVTAQYLPFYLLGLVLFCSAPIRNSAIRPNVVIGILVVSAYAALSLLHLPTAVENLAWHFVTPAVRCWAALAVMWVGSKFLDTPSRVMDYLRASIYTFYMFHYMFIYVAANLFAPLRENSALFFLCVVSFAGAAGLATHAFLVSRSPLLLYAFNGRIARARPSAAAGQLVGTSSKP